jgi:PEP-CTERM motif
MKKVVLSLVLLALFAGTASAYVQVGHLIQPQNELTGTRLDPNTGTSAGLAASSAHIEPMGTLPSTAAAPVPEPGTMALASLGLLAIGAAHKRRQKKQ